jgi:hypothetical protein
MKLNDYYSIKNLYDEEYKMMKLQLIKNNSFSWKEKIIELSKKKPKCVNCKRNVGTIFSRKLDDNFNIILKAECGDKNKPCPLKIEIVIDGFIDYIPDTLNEYYQQINTLKNNIIIYKNNIVFGYINSNLQEMNKITKDLEHSIVYYNLLKNKLIDILDNPLENDELNTLHNQLYQLIDRNATLLNEYKKTNDNTFLKEIVETYIHTLTPLLLQIRNLKYKYITVDFNNNDQTFHFIGKKYNIPDLEHSDNENYIQIKSFVTGNTTTVKKTKKIKPVANNKTKKNNIVLDDDI